jgi:hypothetical protein
LALSIALLWCSSVEAQTPIAADRFVHSVGVNLHLHHDGTLYREDFDLVKSRLVELGVRHHRDGMIDTEWQEYYDRHNALGLAGIKGLFIVSADVSNELLHSFPPRVSQSFEAYEAPNEPNWSGNPDWAAALRTTLGQLRALKQFPAVAMFPVYGPSLTEQSAYAELGDISGLVDAGNLHNYFAGRHPGTPGWGANGYGSINWNLQNIRPYIGATKPIVTTETGYWDDPLLQDSIPPAVAGKYVPRVLLEQFRKGIARTYMYELVDYPEAGKDFWSGYGLLTVDGTRKPAFNAMQGLLSLLADPGPPIVTRPITYSIQGASADVRSMMFQKRNGSYYLAIWIETSGYDVNTRTAIVVPPQTVTIGARYGPRAVSLHRWQADGRVTRTAISMSATGFVPITISDTLTVLELRTP